MTTRISDFIRDNLEPILQNWEDFAGTILGTEQLDKTALRDHAEQMLVAIASDLCTSQSETEQADKSKGLASNSTAPKKPALTHGSERHDSGFSMMETASEFRALRASVVSLWTDSLQKISRESLEDLTRFNEAIDQALTQSLKAYAQLKEKETRLFGAVLSASPDPIFVLDDEGNFCFVNKAATRFFGLDPDTIIGKCIFDLEYAFGAEFKSNLRKVIAVQSTHRGKFSFKSDFDQQGKFEFILAPVLDKKQNIEATVCVSRDITQQTLAEEKMWHTAHHDDLTGLPNRRLFLDRMEQEIKHAKRSNLSFSVLYLDLDGFKEVNDLFGHDEGDRLLRTVADRLMDCIREEDTLARLGGDEFTVILTGVDQRKDAELVAESIIDALSMPFDIAQRSVHISASIGISCYLENATNPEKLLQAADQAMYMAKKSDSRVSHASSA